MGGRYDRPALASSLVPALFSRGKARWFLAPAYSLLIGLAWKMEALSRKGRTPRNAWHWVKLVKTATATSAVLQEQPGDKMFPSLTLSNMTLVRHFEAAVFPLVLHLRRSLFADLSAFSSEAVAALSTAGANGPDSGATQREEQVRLCWYVCLSAL